MNDLKKYTPFVNDLFKLMEENENGIEQKEAERKIYELIDAHSISKDDVADVLGVISSYLSFCGNVRLAYTLMKLDDII